MNRSIWKIPRVIQPRPSQRKTPEKSVDTYQRAAVIGPGLIGQTIQVHNGRKWIPVHITERFIGYKCGAFALTKKRVFHKLKKKKK